MKRVLLTAALIFLAGCLPPVPDWQPDQAARAEHFAACLKAIPKGPESTVYNDWDEVVEACGHIAYTHSLRCVANCPKSEARP